MPSASLGGLTSHGVEFELGVGGLGGGDDFGDFSGDFGDELKHEGKSDVFE